MNRDTQLRFGAIAVVIALFAWMAFGNFVSAEKRRASDLWPDNSLRLGLDLQGGIHWVLGVDIDVAVDRELSNFVAASIVDQLEDDGITLDKPVVVDGVLTFTARSPEDAAAVEEAADDTNVLDSAGSEGLSRSYTLSDRWQEEVRERTMSQVLEVLRLRITDPATGIAESVVTRQGNDRVLVQIPGGGTDLDRERATDMIGSTGHLEFKIVQDAVLNQAEAVEQLRKRHPELELIERHGFEAWRGDGKMIAVEQDPDTKRVVSAFLVPEEPDITGEFLDDARVDYDRQQRAIVAFRFNAEGGRLFGDLTEANKRKPLAIILDHKVYSAPEIRERIGSRGQITGRFTPQEAADLAVVLRAGALSVPVVIEEERTVGPTLGQDSIDAGSRAAFVSLLVIVLFAGVYYRLSGLYAALSLTVNLILLVGVMTLFEATLTLPGIAGLVLTVGMAIDANVIIFERIREELAVGKTPRAAVATGFSKALWTVLDANITTLITALVLYEFGTGPVKGFAVTLSIGIVTSVFTALVVTRLLFDLYPGNRPVQQLSI